MDIFIAIISILGISAAVWAIGKIAPLRVCPICAGVAGTWLWMLAARTAGYPINSLIIGMLMGGSAVGIAYQLERRLASSRSVLPWKMLFIPAGFAAAYGAAASAWLTAAGGAGAAALIAYAFLRTGDRPSTPHRKSAVRELTRNLDQCC